MQEGRTKCFFVSPEEDFLKKITEILFSLSAENPLALARATFFFPTRRLVRLFQAHVLSQSAYQSAILPRCYGFSDFWQLPCLGLSQGPPSSWVLRGLYVNHVQACLRKNGLSLSFVEVHARALELIAFKEALDQALSPWPLAEDLWQVTPPSLEGWQMLTQGLENLPSKASFFNEALGKLDALWEKDPWPHPLYTFGVLPETAQDHQLFKVFLKQPQGHVYFWSHPPCEEGVAVSHPQASLISYIAKDRASPCADGQSALTRWVYSVFAPQAVPLEEAPSLHLRMHACQDLFEEAELISWAIKRVIVETDQDVALITSHKRLRTLVRLHLRKQGIEIDDAAGLSLLETKEGILGTLLLKWLNNPLCPLRRLSLLKHPLVTFNLLAEEVRAQARQWEADIRQQDLRPFMPPVFNHLEELSQRWPSHGPWQTYLTLHQSLLETVAPSLQGNEHLEKWFQEAKEARFEHLSTHEYQMLVIEAWRRTHVRPAYGVHPRAFIWDIIQAQGHRPFHLILGSFNEGTWPSRPQTFLGLEEEDRGRLNLTSHNTRVGGWAQRLVPLLLAPRVLITRAEREEGSLTTPSRWWQRLHLSVKAAGLKEEVFQPEPWKTWLFSPAVPEKPMKRPFLPSSNTYKREISVTQIERLLADPFTFRWEKEWFLKPLPSLSAEPDPRVFGQLVHQLLYQEVKGEALSVLPLFQAFPLWSARVEKILRAFRQKQEKEKDFIQHSFLEVKGEITLANWTIRAMADRIDIMKDGSIRLIDYKTGPLPSRKEVEDGPRVQLPLIAFILQQQGFRDIPPLPLSSLSYWGLRGDHKGFQELSWMAKGDEKLQQLLERAVDRVMTALKHYGDSLCFPDPRTPPPFDQITRTAEWLGL